VRSGLSLAQAEAMWKAARTKQDFDAVGAYFESLLKAEPNSAQDRVRYADLLVERFNNADAESLYQEALKLDPKNTQAYLGLAEIYTDDFGNGEDSARSALEVDPKLYRAWEIIARIALEDSNYAKAADAADKALAINPDAVEAIAVHATIEMLNDKSPDAWVAKIGNRGEGYEDIARELVINRRYVDAITYYRKAIAMKPDLWSAHSQLGIALMRFGQNDEARKELEIAYNASYGDNPTSNTLRLMDTYKDYDTFTWPNATAPVGILKLDKKESAVLEPYFETEMKRAMATYEQKYGYHMTKPVQVEVYRQEGDFGVRVMGLPGVGLLGVTFDTVVAMDGPASRAKQEGYHWASVLWHELSHVYTIAMTNERIPRWFTEGIAVHEESATTPDWGDRLSPSIITALKGKKLLSIADMDRGFVHPTYEGQVIVSYFEAGKICDYIVKRWGNAKLVDMIHAFAQDRPTVDVIREQLKMEPAEFDKDFQADLDTQTAKTVAGFDQWSKDLRALNEEIKDDKAPSDLLTRARALEDVFPEYVEAGNAYVIAADYCVKEGNKACAMAELGKYSRIGGRDLESMEQYADLLSGAGNKKDAAAALERMIYVFPADTGLHQKLGAIDLDIGKNDEAVREFQALVALKPGDVAGSHYDLARALKADGQNDKAREEAITALETAPEYRPAQKLLLELSGDTGKN
jgi:tetratricopeptide (TPR) repeat protein